MNKALVLVLVIAACSEGKKPELKGEPERSVRREPPTRDVRAFPPHAIRPDGVGPYKLGASVRQVLDELKSGPRILQYSLPNVIQRDILRAEEEMILIGAEPQGKATFISVVRADIARTEAGIHVGSTRAELGRALGAPLDDPERAQDPRIVIPSTFKNARILLDGTGGPDDKIVGIVVATEPERKEPPSEPREQIVKTNGDELSLVTRESEKLLAPPTRVTGLVFAALLRNPSDGRDDIVAISRTEDAQSRTWSLVAFRLHEGKLLRVIEPFELYKLTATSARWIGAELRDLELYLELTSRADSIEAGGLLTTTIGDKIRDIVVISPVSAPRRKTKAIPHEPNDAGTYDAASASERAAQ